MKRRLAAVMAAGFLAAGVQGATFDIDPGHSEIGFGIRHLVSKVRGRFRIFSGTIEFEQDKPAALKTDVTIKTDSIDTNNARRDDHLRSPDFFNVPQFSSMTFHSTGAKVVSKDKVELTGSLTLLGVTKPVTLAVDLGGLGTDPEGAVRAGFSATGRLRRKDFGMAYNVGGDKNGVIGDEVELTLDVEAIERKPAK